MKLADYLILALVALVLFLVIRRSVRRKASGNTCGCGGCAGCSARENCAQQTKRT
ncbi:MAG TPA: FeoB-associated Cys-rich membrane protein [Clostridia bacterium]|nr:FeoB-associated Cys-rich membrane protein [Clostridia bacterium]